MTKDTTTPDRLPPRSQEAERCVLGSCLRDNKVIDDVALLVRADSFYEDANQKIWSALLSLHQQSKPVDAVLLAEELLSRKLPGGAGSQLDEVGGAPYLYTLWEASPTAGNALYYARILQDYALKRALIHAATEIARDALDQVDSGEALLAIAEQRILAIAQQGQRPFNTSDAPELVQIFRQDFDTRCSLDGDGITGIASEWLDLDDLMGGAQVGEVTVIAARPTCGKSSFASQWFLTACLNRHVPGLYLTVEQNKAELMGRWVSCWGYVPHHHIRKGRPQGDDVDKIGQVLDAIQNESLAIDFSPGINLAGIRALCKQRLRVKPFGFLVVDYINRIEPDNPRENRAQQLAPISRGLKRLTQELGIHTLLLAQINREATKRPGGRPHLEDIKECGNMEEDMDNVLLLHPEEESGGGHVLNVEVAKQRNGPRGLVKLAAIPHFLRYENLAQPSAFRE